MAAMTATLPTENTSIRETIRERVSDPPNPVASSTGKSSKALLQKHTLVFPIQTKAQKRRKWQHKDHYIGSNVNNGRRDVNRFVVAATLRVRTCPHKLWVPGTLKGLSRFPPWCQHKNELARSVFGEGNYIYEHHDHRINSENASHDLYGELEPRYRRQPPVECQNTDFDKEYRNGVLD